ncbi:MAG TPA: ParB/RepB/Spo0J family partition protein [Anaerolineales bacterium]|nr:ParB/RepB/Spo0J family partition protein [Anaerolineales bacterium]
MTRKTGLGKGLDALIPIGPSAVPDRGIMLISTDRISPNPRQPRARFNPEELAELASSIREHGVLQPLIVTHGPQPEQYILIAGERRLIAAREAGLLKVPAIVREASQQELVELALVENVQREDLSPLEAAEAYRQLADEFGLPHEEIAARVGKSRVAVTNTLRLLKLPEDIRRALAESAITEGHARALLALPTPQAQSAALQSIRKNGLNVRQTEELVRKMLGHRPNQAPKPEMPAELRSIEERLRQRLGTRVTLNPRQTGGNLVIHYYSDEELDALISLILGETD